MVKNESNRREFLRGESARRAMEHALFDAVPEPGAPTPFVLQFSDRAMACEFAVFINQNEAPKNAEPAIDVLGLVKTLEQRLTVYQDSSEISLINREAAKAPVRIESDLFQLLQTGRDLSEVTGGAFDMTSGTLAKVWGFYRRDGKIPGTDALENALRSVGWQHLLLNEAEQSIRFATEGVELNLGAIGKGYALDVCAEELKRRGANNFLMHGGQSSVIAAGVRSDDARGWPIAIRHPLRPQTRLGEIILRDESLGTSGSGNQFFRHQGKRLGHILDPRTGQPVEGVLAATVITPSATDADALATALFVMGYEQAVAFCDSRPDIKALFVLSGKGPDGIETHTIGDFELLPPTSS